MVESTNSSSTDDHDGLAGLIGNVNWPTTAGGWVKWYFIIAFVVLPVVLFLGFITAGVYIGLSSAMHPIVAIPVTLLVVFVGWKILMFLIRWGFI